MSLRKLQYPEFRPPDMVLLVHGWRGVANEGLGRFIAAAGLIYFLRIICEDDDATREERLD